MCIFTYCWRCQGDPCESILNFQERPDLLPQPWRKGEPTDGTSSQGYLHSVRAPWPTKLPPQYKSISLFIWLDSQTFPSSPRSWVKTRLPCHGSWQRRQEWEAHPTKGWKWGQCPLCTNQSTCIRMSWNFLCQLMHFPETRLKPELISNKGVSMGYV